MGKVINIFWSVTDESDDTDDYCEYNGWVLQNQVSLKYNYNII